MRIGTTIYVALLAGVIAAGCSSDVSDSPAESGAVRGPELVRHSGEPMSELAESECHDPTASDGLSQALAWSYSLAYQRPGGDLPTYFETSFPGMNLESTSYSVEESTVSEFLGEQTELPGRATVIVLSLGEEMPSGMGQPFLSVEGFECLRVDGDSVHSAFMFQNQTGEYLMESADDAVRTIVLPDLSVLERPVATSSAGSERSELTLEESSLPGEAIPSILIEAPLGIEELVGVELGDDVDLADLLSNLLSRLQDSNASLAARVAVSFQFEQDAVASVEVPMFVWETDPVSRWSDEADTIAMQVEAWVEQNFDEPPGEGRVVFDTNVFIDFGGSRLALFRLAGLFVPYLR